jgi:hypothetical protein
MHARYNTEKPVRVWNAAMADLIHRDRVHPTHREGERIVQIAMRLPQTIMMSRNNPTRSDVC